MRFLRVLLLLPFFALCLSCNEHQVESDDVLPYVYELLHDRDSREYSILDASTEPAPGADICFLGRSEDAYIFAARLLEYDVHDNVDGSPESDELKDFAGETLSIIDNVLPAAEAYDSLTVESLRISSIKTILAAMDTLTYVSPYDTYGIGKKNSTKVFILGAVEHGLWVEKDARKLFEMAGSSVKLISTINLTLDKLFADKAGKDVRVAVVCRSDNAAPELYKQLFMSKAESLGLKNSSCYIVPSHSDSLLYRVLQTYQQTEQNYPLDAVLVDDYSLDIEALKLQHAEMLSIMNESSLTFGRMLAPDFDIYDCFEVTVEALYDILRQNNLFTHNITQPQTLHLSAVSRADESGDSVILIPVTYVQN